MRRRMVAIEGFDTTVAALRDSVECRLVVDALIARAQGRPESGLPIPGFSARMLKSRSYGDCPALRLVYRWEGDVIYLYDITTYDELDG